jgi:hypothetical protein
MGQLDSTCRAPPLLHHRVVAAQVELMKGTFILETGTDVSRVGKGL